jgi:hypothetical protein
VHVLAGELAHHLVKHSTQEREHVLVALHGCLRVHKTALGEHIVRKAARTGRRTGPPPGQAQCLETRTRHRCPARLVAAQKDCKSAAVGGDGVRNAANSAAGPPPVKHSAEESEHILVALQGG